MLSDKVRFVPILISIGVSLLKVCLIMVGCMTP